MDQKNAPKNTEENMSVFRFEKLYYNEKKNTVFSVDKWIDETVYFPQSEEDLLNTGESIGIWRLTKKRENKTSEWEKVLESKITREQRLKR